LDSLQSPLKIALHGFLGLPSDWNIPGVIAIDYLKTNGLGPEVSLLDWGHNFCDYVSKQFGRRPLTLLGYSQGGRLALHALRARPELWSEAHLISTNPGLQTEFDKQARKKLDKHWADRFLNEPWNKVLGDWNSQPVFASDPEPGRKENQFNRQALAKCLESWSLGNQDDFREWISETKLKITWWAGENDEKYKAIVSGLKIGSSQSKKIVPETGHRVIFQNKFEV
jgi:2-succinyl-6-hydroxy-2,4-cyclohexadiene-1-carboxylate synthase